MATVLVCGLGDLGGWALEFLARSSAVDRIVTVRRSAQSGPSRASLAAIGAVFQDRIVECEHLTGDLTDVAWTAELLRDIEPDVILSTATARSPRSLMSANVDPDIRAILRRATFGMWLPSHLLPATRLIEATLEAGVNAPVVNVAFPDVVNPAVWKRLAYGPIAGAGNGEVSAAMLQHFVASRQRVPASDVRVALVASHAFFTHGPEVPYWARVWIRGEDVTSSFAIESILETHPEPIDWRATSTFSVFAASAVKNVLGLLTTQQKYVHVTAPNGLPGSYPAWVSSTGIELALPDELTFDRAVDITTAGNRFDGIEEIADDGAVSFTPETAAAMAELGYDGLKVQFDELEDRVEQLDRLFARIAGTD